MKILKKFTILSLILILPILFISCSKKVTADDNGYSNVEDTIGIRGVLTELNEYDDVLVINVDGKLEEDTIYDDGIVDVHKDVKITIDNEEGEFDTSELEVGLRVEIKFEGSVKETHPVQGTAKSINIITK